MELQTLWYWEMTCLAQQERWRSFIGLFLQLKDLIRIVIWKRWNWFINNWTLLMLHIIIVTYRCHMNLSAALYEGNRKSLQQLWFREHTGNISCSGRSNWRPTNTEKRWRDDEKKSHRQRQKDFSVEESVSYTETVCRQMSLFQVYQVRIPPPSWSFKVSFSSMLLLPSTLLTSCEMRTWGSLLSDDRWCPWLRLPVFLCAVWTHLQCFQSEEQWSVLSVSDISEKTEQSRLDSIFKPKL